MFAQNLQSRVHGKNGENETGDRRLSWSACDRRRLERMPHHNISQPCFGQELEKGLRLEYLALPAPISGRGGALRFFLLANKA